jgi:hypothetical protein
MSQIVNPARRLALDKIISNIFKTKLPTIERDGTKFLKPLIGPKILNYYPERFDLPKVRHELSGVKMDKITEDEGYRVWIADSRRRRGKGAPKKCRLI